MNKHFDAYQTMVALSLHLAKSPVPEPCYIALEAKRPRGHERIASVFLGACWRRSLFIR
jgi:hypothetical protein